MLVLAAGHPDVYRALIGPKSSATALRGYRQSIATILREHLAEQPQPWVDDLTVTSLSWALVGLLGAVTDRTDPVPPETAWRHFQQMCAHLPPPGGTRSR